MGWGALWEVLQPSKRGDSGWSMDFITYSSRDGGKWTNTKHLESSAHKIWPLIGRVCIRNASQALLWAEWTGHSVFMVHQASWGHSSLFAWSFPARGMNHRCSGDLGISACCSKVLSSRRAPRASTSRFCQEKKHFEMPLEMMTVIDARPENKLKA